MAPPPHPDGVGAGTDSTTTASDYDNETRINTPEPTEHASRKKSSFGPNVALNPSGDLEKGVTATDGFPVPESGFHRIGVAFENMTVYGSGATQRSVESFEIAALRMWDIISLLQRFAGIKTGPKRPIISVYRDPNQGVGR